MSGISGLAWRGWLRVACRIALMLVWLLFCLAGLGLSRLFRIRHQWPRRFLSGVATLSGVLCRVDGQISAAEHRVLLVNHVSWLDIPLIAGASGAIFVGHDGLGEEPLVRWLCALNDTVLIARGDPSTIRHQVGQVRDAISNHTTLAIFPEGTTSEGVGLLPFKSSLLSALENLPENAVIQPVMLSYGQDSSSIAWIGTEHGLDNFLRIMARKEPITAKVQFLEPLAGEQLNNRKTMAKAAQAAIATALAQVQLN